jgi:FkbM family methyltransferase
MNNYKSQFEQDRHVLSVYNNKRNGYFIEIGAYDGIESSNTYVLEKDFGWNGICIECNPRFYNTLINSRNCLKSDNAIYNIDGREMEFYDSGGYAGLVETNNHKHIINDPKIIVKTKKLVTLLDEIKAPSFIEYLSLDTEGSEYEILKEHNFDKYKFGYICVEHNRIEKNRKAIRELLESKGYIFKRENGDSYWGIIDDEYILNDLNKYI